MAKGGSGSGRKGGGGGQIGTPDNQIRISRNEAASLVASGRATPSNRESITLRDEPIGSGRGRVAVDGRRGFMPPAGSISLGGGRFLIPNTASNVANARQQGASISRGTRAQVVFRVNGGVTDQMIQTFFDRG